METLRTAGDTDLESPANPFQPLSGGAPGVPRPSDSTSVVPLALPGSEGLSSFPETPGPTLLKDGSVHTKTVPLR